MNVHTSQSLTQVKHLAAAAGEKHHAGIVHLTGKSVTTLPELQHAQELYAAANRQAGATRQQLLLYTLR